MGSKDPPPYPAEAAKTTTLKSLIHVPTSQNPFLNPETALPSSSVPPSSPHHTRMGAIYKASDGAGASSRLEDFDLLAPMVEVPDGNGGTQVVFRPWTARDMRNAAAHLPDVKEGG